jgi:hypothetical protein
MRPAHDQASGGDRQALLSLATSGGTGQSYPCDAHNGPVPLACNIKRVHGDKSLLVHYVIECHVCETVGPPISQSITRSPVLANRYRMWSEVDEDHFAVRVLGRG